MKEQKTVEVALQQKNRLMTFTITLVAAAICFAAAPLCSQTASSSAPLVHGSPTTTLQVTSQLVVLDTVVYGPGGKPVANLDKNDFRVLQDGVEQKISYFEVHRKNPTLPMEPTIDDNGKPNWGSATKTIIVLDELNTQWADMAYSRIEVNKYLHSLPEALPGPTMVMYVDDYGFHPLGPYTRDQKTLLKEVADHKGSLPGKLTRGDQEELLGESFALLQQIAIAARGESGRKLILWVGAGFPSVDVTELDPDEEDRFMAAVKHITNLLLDARVTVYKIDPSPAPPTPSIGVDDDGDVLTQVSATPTQDPALENFNFNAFVQRTGGQYFYNRNDLDMEISEATGEGSTYYTLVYRPAADIKAIDYHTIRIVMRDPHMHARTKSGFYPPAVDQLVTDPKELGFDLYEAAVSGMNYTGLGTSIKKCDAGDGPAHVRCQLKVDTSNITFADTPGGGHKTTLIAVMVALNEKNKIVSKTGREFTESIPSSDKRPLNTGYFSIKFEGVIPPGTHSARIIVRDVSGRIGTADIDLSKLPHLPAMFRGQGRRRGGEW